MLRTSWVYAATGKNFVLTMLKAATRDRRLRVVADQIGCPTAAPDLAAAILGIVDRLDGGWQAGYAGVFHAAGSGSTSWHGLATATFAAASTYGLAPPEIDPIATVDWPTPARRPPDSRLDCRRLEQVFGQRLPDWQMTLPAVIAQVFTGSAAARPATAAEVSPAAPAVPAPGTHRTPPAQTAG